MKTVTISQRNLIIILIINVTVLIFLFYAIFNGYHKEKNQEKLTQIEKFEKDSLQRVLDQQVLAQAEAIALGEQKELGKTIFLSETGLDKLQLPGIYWEWGTDSASIVEGIKTFKLYDEEADASYPAYRWRIQSLVGKTFGGSGEQSKRRSNSLVDLFIKVPSIFKVIYDLNKGIVGALKTSWGLPNQGEELVKYLGTTKYPYESHFEVFFQKHTKEGESGVFNHSEWPALDSLLQKNYPETFKSEKDTRREYGHWRIVRANLSPEAKGILLCVLTDYNGGAAAQPAATRTTTTNKPKSISDWFN